METEAGKGKKRRLLDIKITQALTSTGILLSYHTVLSFAQNVKPPETR